MGAQQRLKLLQELVILLSSLTSILMHARLKTCSLEWRAMKGDQSGSPQRIFLLLCRISKAQPLNIHLLDPM